MSNFDDATWGVYDDMDVSTNTGLDDRRPPQGPTPTLTLSGGATDILVRTGGYAQAQPTNTGDDAWAVWDAPRTPNMDVRARMSVSAQNASTMLAVRVVDTNNFWYLYSYDGSSHATTCGYTIEGSSTDVYSSSAAFNISSETEFRILADGDDLYFWRGGVLLHSEIGNDTLNTATKVGWRSKFAFSGGNARLYEMLIRPLPVS